MYVDIIKIEKFTTFVTTTMTYKNIVDFILHFLEYFFFFFISFSGIKLVFKCHKISLFLVDGRTEELMMRGISEDKMKYINSYEHSDSVLGEKRAIK